MTDTQKRLARIDAYVRIHGAARRNPTPQRKIKLSAVESEAQTIEIFGTPDKPRTVEAYLTECKALAQQPATFGDGRYVGPVIGHAAGPREFRGTVN